MDAFAPATGGRGCRRWAFHLLALALAGSGIALAQVVQVPGAHLHHAEGSVAHAPPGEREWQDVVPRRVLQRGDRLWTDRGSRAELQAGGHALRMDGQTQLVLDNVVPTATQVSLTQGTLAATVAGLQPGDEFEVGTPNLAFRARSEGDYRIDVDAKQGTTRVAVLTGVGVVYGEKGEAMEIRTGQRVTFRARNLARVQQGAFVATDDFDRWAGARRRGEPTVRMPELAQSAPTPAPSTQLVHRGPDLVISGPASGLPGARQAAATKVLVPAATAAAPVAKAQPIPAVRVAPALPAAVPLRVTAQAPAQAPAPAAAPVTPPAPAQAAAQAGERAAQERRAAAQAQEARRAEERRAAAQAEARRAEERRRSVAAKRAEDEKRAAQARREQEARRVAAARKAEEARRVAAAKKAQEARQLAARKAAEEQRRAAARKAEDERLAEARRKQLARLQEQARREEQSVQARRQEQRQREEQAWHEEQAQRAEQMRREEQARREEAMRQRAVAEQARREQERREQEVWLRQQQVVPARPAPMGVPIGVPARRVS